MVAESRSLFTAIGLNKQKAQEMLKNEALSALLRNAMIQVQPEGVLGYASAVMDPASPLSHAGKPANYWSRNSKVTARDMTGSNEIA
ncbi:hypothetical protein NDU88_002537 [Pleurodeles waltl]|uniref:Uncharacterized protein n=1 Tax=Pleurodeles waltl TaxID=8319 RepID=A0AAV7VEQ4_PLEWA|nr:hypothetical protein NDU88_002537 [Pleurodeles waltl]